MNEYTVRTLTEDDAKEICLWKYDGEYAVYNMPKWEECLAKNFGIADEEGRQKNFATGASMHRKRAFRNSWSNLHNEKSRPR